MAGSYRHVVDDQGRLGSNERVVGMLENGGDVYEAVEEMYGMIWYLAGGVAALSGVDAPLADFVEKARTMYEAGIELWSPGIETPEEYEDYLEREYGR